MSDTDSLEDVIEEEESDEREESKDPEEEQEGLTRRDFMKKAGIASLVLAGLTTGINLLVWLIRNASNVTDPVNEFKENKGKYPYNLERISVDGQNILLCGVVHDKENIAKYGKFYQDLISQSQLVVSEVPPMIQIEDSSTAAFFNTLANMSAEYSKNMVFADTYPAGIYYADFRATLLSNLGLNVGLATIGLWGGTRCMFSAGKLDDAGKAKQSRKYLGLSATLYYLYFSFIMSLLPGIPAGAHSLFYNHIDDYRNIRFSESFESIGNILSTDELDDGKHITYFIGDDHVKASLFYHKHPLWRNIKKATYWPTYNQLANKDMIKFAHNGNEWKEIARKRF